MPEDKMSQLKYLDEMSVNELDEMSVVEKSVNEMTSFKWSFDEMPEDKMPSIEVTGRDVCRKDVYR